MRIWSTSLLYAIMMTGGVSAARPIPAPAAVRPGTTVAQIEADRLAEALPEPREELPARKPGTERDED